MAVVPSRSWPVVPCDLSTSHHALRRESAGVREQGLLTTASDERSGKPAHSRRLAPRPLRPVLSKPARSRGQVGSITPQSRVRRPYAKALRVVEIR
jgi:hypothetical protein